MRKSLKYLLTAGLALGSILPMANGQASAINRLEYFNQETKGVNYKITQNLKNTYGDDPFDEDTKFYKLDIEENLLLIGCTNIGNVREWTASETSTGTSRLENLDGNDHQAVQDYDYFYEIPTNSVIGWQFVPATFTANNEDTANLDGGFKVPITPTTTTSNGTSVAAILGAGFNSTNTMAYFENSSVTNSDSDVMTDVQEWVAGTDRNVADGLEGVLNVVSNGVQISTSPAVAERIYDVSVKTNLMDSAWMNAGSYTNNAGETEGFLLDTNDWDAANYKVEVALP